MIEKKYTIEGVKFVLLSTHKDMLSAAVTELGAIDEVCFYFYTTLVKNKL